MSLSAPGKLLEKAHGVEWYSTPLLPRVREGSSSVKALNRFLGFQQLLNDELLRHPSITHNEVLEQLEHSDGARLLLPRLMPQWSLVTAQLMIARQRLMIELMGDGPLAQLLQHDGITRSVAVRYDGQSNPTLTHDQHTADPGSLIWEAADSMMGWWESCQSLLPELSAMMPDIGKASGETRTLCSVVDSDYHHEKLAISLATMFILENALSNDVASRLESVICRHGDDHDLPAPGRRFFTTFVRLAQENSLLIQQFLEAWFFSEEGPDEGLFLRQGMLVLNHYGRFWQQFAH